MTPTPTTALVQAEGRAGHGTAAAAGAPPAPRRFRSVRALRAGPVSIRVHPRSLLIGAVLLVAVAVTAAVHLAVGGTPIPYPQVLAALTGGATEASVHLAVTEFRAPRMVAAILVGACLAAAGAITQTVARNPLASPDILGVTAGASAGAVAVLILAGGGAAGLSGVAATVGMPAAAFTAGLVSGVAAYLLAYRNGIDSYRLILVGLGISGFATALTTWMLTLGDVTSAAQALTWMMGSLNGKDWTLVRPMAAAAAVLLGAAVMCGRWLLLAALDEDTAVGLGLRLGLIRVVALSLAVLLAAVATVVGGPLVFVALAAPQIARLLTGSPVPPVTVSALTGAVFVLVADTAAANLLTVPLPVGVATAVLGAPYLIYLVIRSQRRPQ
ncbi:FecCD family ABC transporter permease [Kocuria rosea]|uniref:FecCD family ABC transporter permease n=1 Tax=Kocuria rosea TaxID=1275 RepID=UPI00140881E7|nr:iron ABC transporter permease [Kocuria rosea]